jgi:SAM-dependent methyltransferase
MADPEEIRAQQRQTWDRFSAGWTRWDEVVLPMMEPVAAEMIRSLGLAEDSDHLDIASGTGEPGLSIASLVPRGRVVLTDLSASMLATANANMTRRGLTNVEVRECGVDDLPFDDEAFDTITCRFGFMFFPSIPAAVAELLRVLRPGGRLSAAVWAEPPGNAWATIPMAAIGTEVELPPTPPDAPSLFRCAAPSSIASVFSAGGMRDVAETDVHGSLEVASGEEYWSFMTEVAAPVVSGLAGVDGATRDRIRTLTIDKAQAYQNGTGVSLPLHARCIIGTK